MSSYFSRLLQQEMERIGELDPKVSDMLNDLVMFYKWTLYSQLQGCESPIEQLMVLALMEEVRCNPDLPLWFEKQVQIGDYRVDFMLHIVDRSEYPVKKIASVIVECDGHDFHEKTKDQAKRDKPRDRFLQSEGFAVLRFAGSEIWKSPYTCAREAVNILCRKVFGHDWYHKSDLQPD
ncbi:endonuclease domain-containing protein [Effusibacillus consociatus]|uniref:Endonuclease domain-containing protein n=1 Tax=Effusibacillus consociatus TaxID=1117041 RepID=A0ABV9Q4H1_9BACL